MTLLRGVIVRVIMRSLMSGLWELMVNLAIVMAKKKRFVYLDIGALRCF
jgi:hypothetical protein